MNCESQRNRDSGNAFKEYGLFAVERPQPFKCGECSVSYEIHDLQNTGFVAFPPTVASDWYTKNSRSWTHYFVEEPSAFNRFPSRVLLASMVRKGTIAVVTQEYVSCTGKKLNLTAVNSVSKTNPPSARTQVRQYVFQLVQGPKRKIAFRETMHVPFTSSRRAILLVLVALAWTSNLCM